jgi:hypothetical protein
MSQGTQFSPIFISPRVARVALAIREAAKAVAKARQCFKKLHAKPERQTDRDQPAGDQDGPAFEARVGQFARGDEGFLQGDVIEFSTGKEALVGELHVVLVRPDRHRERGSQANPQHEQALKKGLDGILFLWFRAVVDARSGFHK